MWFSKAGMSCAEPEKLDSSPGRYNSACPVRKRRILTGINANRVFVCWSPLACLQGAGASWLLRCLVPSFRSSPVLQRSTETAGCSVFKSLVCYLNEAFRAQKKKINTLWYCENTTMCWTLDRTLDVLGMSWFSCIISCVFCLPTSHLGLLLEREGMKLTWYL